MVGWQGRLAPIYYTSTDCLVQFDPMLRPVAGFASKFLSVENPPKKFWLAKFTATNLLEKCRYFLLWNKYSWIDIEVMHPKSALQ